MNGGVIRGPRGEQLARVLAGEESGQIPMPMGYLGDVFPVPRPLEGGAPICPLMFATRVSALANFAGQQYPQGPMSASDRENATRLFARIADAGLCVADQCRYTPCGSSAAAREGAGFFRRIRRAWAVLR